MAEALDYAHAQGVVHRDIKPSNILIDELGEPWITDFGLARIESTTPLTLTGDVLGTLRYMSPEQVSLRRQAVDHRTDIYSLGATLYELLTLEPAFAGATRQELLRQIVDDEPHALRRLDAAIPIELETITLKAMAKDAVSRYASGRELADDLRRFLLDKPILARPPTLAERATKWSRRHRSLVGISAGALLLTLLLAIAGLMVSNAMILREQKRTAEALAEAEAGQTAAAEGRAQADANLRQALAAVDRMLTRVSEERLSRVPQAEHVRRALLEDALQFYKGFLRERASDARLRREVAWAHLRVAVLYRDLGQQAEAEREFRRGLADFERLLKEFPGREEYSSAVVSGCTGLGQLLRGIGGREFEAETIYRRAVANAERLAAGEPHDIGFRAQLAESLHGLGYVLWELRRFPEAEQAFHNALQIEQQLARQSPEETQFALAQADIYNSLGLALRQAGQPDEAQRAHRQALDLLSTVARLNPDLDITNDLARTYGHLGLALDKLGQHQEALSSVRHAWELRKEQYATWPTSQHARAELALTTYALAQLLAAQGQMTEAELHYREAVDLAEMLVRDSPTVTKNRSDLARILARLGELLMEVGRGQEAEPFLRRALELRTALAEQFPELAEYQKTLAASRLQFAVNAARLGKQDEALAEYRAARQMLDRHPSDDEELNRLLAAAAEALVAASGHPAK